MPKLLLDSSDTYFESSLFNLEFLLKIKHGYYPTRVNLINRIETKLIMWFFLFVCFFNFQTLLVNVNFCLQ